MIGKKIRINDYKFTYGKEVMYVNVYGAFKSGKSGKGVVFVRKVVVNYFSFILRKIII